MSGRTLVGPVALVTGAAGGMGRAITRALLDAGAETVYAWDRVPVDDPQLRGDVVDLGSETDVVRALSGVDVVPQIVVNAAGFYANRETFHVDLADFRRTLEINLVSAYLIQREIGARLIADGLTGAFVNVSSVAGKHAFPHQVDYVVSKAALIGLTRAAALDLAPSITVNAVAPGTVATPMIDKVIEDVARETGLSIEDQRAAFVSSIPALRMQEPEEIAAAIVFLASAAARSITGETLNIDGGVTRD